MIGECQYNFKLLYLRNGLNCDLGVCGDESKRGSGFVGEKVELSLGWTCNWEVLV